MEDDCSLNAKAAHWSGHEGFVDRFMYCYSVLAGCGKPSSNERRPSPNCIKITRRSCKNSQYSLQEKSVLQRFHSPVSWKSTDVESSKRDAVSSFLPGSQSRFQCSMALNAEGTLEMTEHALKVFAERLRTAGLTLADLRDAGYAAVQLREAGYSVTELRQAGFTLTELQDAGFLVADLSLAGFTAAQLQAKGYSVCDLRQAGFTAAHLRQAGLALTDAEKQELVDAQLRAAGFNAGHLRQMGRTAEQLWRAGFTLEDLLQEGFTSFQFLFHYPNTITPL